MHRAFKKLFTYPLLALIMTCAACSTTDNQQAAGYAAVDEDGLPILTAQQKEDGVICKREPVTGTRFAKKVCTTREQRERDKRLAEEQLRNSTRHSRPSTSE